MSNREDKFKKSKPALGSFVEKLEGKRQDSDSDYIDKIADLELESMFEMGEIIASGGLKTIRKVKDNKTGREIAMAQLKKEHHSVVNVERFIREARTLAGLEHTNIVPIYDIGHTPDVGIFFTMKLLTGETLGSILAKIESEKTTYIDKFPLHKLLEIFNRACDAISYAHTKKVVHLDLKPDNIQISEFGEVSVLDWGMAKRLDSDSLTDYDTSKKTDNDASISANLTKVGAISGTPAYMSPEQARADKDNTGIASDIYSLGATLYTIIYKTAPHSSLTANDIIEKSGKGISPDFPKSKNGNSVPTALRAIAMKAMSMRAEERYNTVNELKNDLELYRNDFITIAENDNLISLSKLFFKRHSQKIALSLVTLLILGGISFFSYSEIQRQKDLKMAEEAKTKASADDFISGTLKKHDAQRRTNDYDKIIESYRKLKGLGYNYPEFWYDEARLFAGKLNFEKALFCLTQVKELSQDTSRFDGFDNLNSELSAIINKLKVQPLNHNMIVHFAIKMDPDTQHQILWDINHDSDKTIPEILETLHQSLKTFNSADIRFKYDIRDGKVKVNLTENPKLVFIQPLYGAPIDELTLNTIARIDKISHYLKSRLTTLNISGYKRPFQDHNIQNSNLEKLVAKNTIFQAYSIDTALKLKHLDIEGSRVTVDRLNSSGDLEYLNIAHTNFTNLDFVNYLFALKTLIIDESMNIPGRLLRELKNKGVDVTIKKAQIQTSSQHTPLPGSLKPNNENIIQLDFPVNFIKAGIYDVTFDMSDKNDSSSFSLLRNGTALCVINNTKENVSESSLITRTVSIPEGKAKLSLINNDSNLNIDSIHFSYIKEIPFVLPGLIEAENFMTMSGINIEATNDSSGGLNVGFIDEGDYLSYEVNVIKGGPYKASFRVSGIKDIKFDLKSGNKILCSVDEPRTGGWQKWKTIERTISLNEDSKNLKIEVTGSSWNINWMQFELMD